MAALNPANRAPIALPRWLIVVLSYRAVAISAFVSRSASAVAATKNAAPFPPRQRPDLGRFQRKRGPVARLRRLWMHPREPPAADARRTQPGKGRAFNKFRIDCC